MPGFGALPWEHACAMRAHCLLAEPAQTIVNPPGPASKRLAQVFCGQRGDDVVDDQPAASGITHSLSNSHRRERLARKTTT